MGGGPSPWTLTGRQPDIGSSKKISELQIVWLKYGKVTTDRRVLAFASTNVDLLVH